MTIAISEDVIRLVGQCPSEDAETLLQSLLDHPSAIMDWSRCESLHAAVLQVLLAADRELKGTPVGDFPRNWLAPILGRKSS